MGADLRKRGSGGLGSCHYSLFGSRGVCSAAGGGEVEEPWWFGQLEGVQDGLLTGCPCRALGDGAVWGGQGDQVHPVQLVAQVAPRAGPDAPGLPGHPTRHHRPTLCTDTRSEDHPGRPRVARTTTVLRLHHPQQLSKPPETQTGCSDTTPTHQNRVCAGQRPYSGDRVPNICGSPARWRVSSALSRPPRAVTQVAVADVSVMG